MRIGEPRFSGGDEAIRNQRPVLACKMADDTAICGFILPRERERILRKFIAVRDIERRGERRSLTDSVGSKYLSDFQHLGLIRLQIGEGDRAIRRSEVDAKTEAFGHE